MTNELACFMLGVNVAEHVRGSTESGRCRNNDRLLSDSPRNRQSIVDFDQHCCRADFRLTIVGPRFEDCDRCVAKAIRAVVGAVATEIMNSLPNELRKNVDDDDHGADEMVDEGDPNTD